MHSDTTSVKMRTLDQYSAHVKKWLRRWRRRPNGGRQVLIEDPSGNPIGLFQPTPLRAAHIPISGYDTMACFVLPGIER